MAAHSNADSHNKRQVQGILTMQEEEEDGDKAIQLLQQTLLLWWMLFPLEEIMTLLKEVHFRVFLSLNSMSWSIHFLVPKS
jgi:hypothetical protein